MDIPNNISAISRSDEIDIDVLIREIDRLRSENGVEARNVGSYTTLNNKGNYANRCIHRPSWDGRLTVESGVEESPEAENFYCGR